MKRKIWIAIGLVIILGVYLFIRDGQLRRQAFVKNKRGEWVVNEVYRERLDSVGLLVLQNVKNYIRDGLIQDIKWEGHDYLNGKCEREVIIFSEIEKKDFLEMLLDLTYAKTDTIFMSYAGCYGTGPVITINFTNGDKVKSYTIEKIGSDWISIYNSLDIEPVKSFWEEKPLFRPNLYFNYTSGLEHKFFENFYKNHPG